MKKNDLIEIEITDVMLSGSGVGHYDGLAVFVPSTVTGDVVLAHILKVKPNVAYAKIEKIIKPSDKRGEIECNSFLKCGGCAFWHIKYSEELKLKENAVLNNLKRIGGVEPEFEPITALQPQNYRNKCQYPVAKNKDGEIIIGFYSEHSHRVVDCPQCALQPEEFSKVVKVFKEFLKENNISIYSEETGKGLVRHLYIRKAAVTGEIMVSVVINGDKLPLSEKLIESLKALLKDSFCSFQININKKKTNVILGDKNITLYGSDYITDVLCGVKIRISPLSFYQVNHDVAELLYKKAAEYLKPQGKTVLDLYCGAGTIGLSLAKEAKSVIGVEIIPEAVEDAKFNAKQNDIKNCEFICADAKKAAEMLKIRGIKPDAVIVDPPRKGCEESLIDIICNDFGPERVVYVSCDSATLARDCKIFESKGYKAQKCATFDMFPRTSHVESVVCLKRQIQQ